MMIKEKSKTWGYISNQIGVIFSKYPVSPNVYTWLTLPPAFLGCFALIYGHIVSGVLLFILSGFLDLVDGAVARKTNQSSYRGAFLDGSLDRVVDFLLIFSYFWIPMQMPVLNQGEWIAIAGFCAIMPSFEVAYANHRKAVEDPEEKIIWRILNRGEMYVLMLLIPFVSMFSHVWSGYLLVLLVVLSGITTLQTFFNTLRLALINETKN